MKTYLVATDGSDVSFDALEYARSTFNPEEHRLIVLGVADESKLIPYLVGEEATLGGINFEEIRQQIENQAHAAVEEAVEFFEAADFEVESIVEFGDPGELICRTARDRDVTTILLGRSGHSTMGELLLGSVSHYVVHHTDRPVTLVPHRESN